MQGMIVPEPGADLRVVPIAGRIGAICEGIRISGELDDASIAAIRAALLKHKVIFFRDQDHLDDAAMEGFTERMGDPIPHPNVADPQGSKYLLNLEESAGYAASIWHTDMTFLPAYPAASVLRAVTLPEAGGDTMWANTASAYQDLPEPLRAMADRLWAIHSNDTDFDADFAGEVRVRVERYVGQKPPRIFRTRHPVVRVHPETGERSLLIGTFVKQLIGFDVRQSQQILALLQDYVTSPEYCVRWRWQAGDVAMWDNRATMHRSVADFGDQPRHLRRATIHGTVPVSVDGEESRPLASAAG
jgi:alpha-ketoglutarate-dependent sulfate ester dioxygenase